MKALLVKLFVCNVITLHSAAQAQSPFNSEPLPEHSKLIEAMLGERLADRVESDTALNYAGRELLIERAVSERYIPSERPDPSGHLEAFRRGLDRAMIESNIKHERYEAHRGRR